MHLVVKKEFQCTGTVRAVQSFYKYPSTELNYVFGAETANLSYCIFAQFSVAFVRANRTKAIKYLQIVTILARSVCCP